MMKYIAFDIDEINIALEISRGEVMRYEDIINEEKSTFPEKIVMHELMKAKWQGKVDTLEEILKFGKEIEL